MKSNNNKAEEIALSSAPKSNNLMTVITATKVQKLSDLVYHILQEKGFSKLFNFEDYRYFKKLSADRPDRAEWIAEQFIFWNSHELSDFADYDF